MPSRHVYRISALAMLMTLSVAGCTPEIHRYMRFPDLWSPGPAPYQRAEAIRHDPYPLNDVGPEIAGGRPREYQQPVNEVERAQMNAPRPVALQPVPVPGLPTVPPSSVTAPPVVSTPSAVTAPPVVTTPPVVTGPPVVTTPYATAPSSPATPYQVQPRSPY
jgi:hypothetical protein